MVKVDLGDLLLDPPDRKIIPNNIIKGFLFIVLIIIFIIFKPVITNIYNSFFLSDSLIKKEESIQTPIINKVQTPIINKVQTPIINKVQTPIIPSNLRYIQVSAFLNTSNDDVLLSKIKKMGLPVIVSKSKKYTRILIGPFDGFNAAKKDLFLVKSKLKSDAFITSKK